ncbi:hypothetical protein C2869_10530 [Saccharobesus litoralis]|uniref:Glycosyltransferase RgtA/B/C/D-like domain-containing protein n=1 Tax=Saccharobesus litoralis TaxID=2172099 RepID=A0A2S0VRW4_9ALTE|nr:glycosyltransferase family 39 protein [Saccharobesus litoralis]AWB66840.1 hypothetical protein C2869_10530 [Saccharobesus litoralis]
MLQQNSIQPDKSVNLTGFWRSTEQLKLFWWAIASLFLIRLTYIPVSDLALFYDEAYYHLWAQTPDWGYYSKPPMVAWLIHLTTSIVGFEGEWTAKLGAPICYCLTAIVIKKIGQQLFNQQTGIVAALLFFTMPLVSVNSLFITTDAPLLLFWSITLWLFILAKSQGQLPLWALAGIAGGLGLLSKYTMGFLALGLLLYVLGNRQTRLTLTKPGMWLATVIAALVFTPNLWWNYQHDFISFQHTSEIAKLNQTLLHPDKFAEFFLGQFFVFGPLSMWLFISYWRRSWQARKLGTDPSKHSAAIHSDPNHLANINDGVWLLIAVAIPVLIFFCVQAFLARAHVNWAAPTYVTASLLIAYYLTQFNRRKLLMVAVSINLGLMLLFYGYQPLQNILGIEAKRNNNPFHRVTGWRETTLLLQEYIQHTPQINQKAEVIWLSDSRKLLSYIHYYLSDFAAGKTAQVLSFNRDGRVDHHYDLKFDLAQNDNLNQAEQNYLFVSEQPFTAQSCFSNVQQLSTITYAVYPSLNRQIYLYQVTGFKGYEFCNQKN